MYQEKKIWKEEEDTLIQNGDNQNLKIKMISFFLIKYQFSIEV